MTDDKLDKRAGELAHLQRTCRQEMPADLRAEVSQKQVDAWRARASKEDPANMARMHPPMQLTLPAALCHVRHTEMTDSLVELSTQLALNGVVQFSTTCRPSVRGVGDVEGDLPRQRHPGLRGDAEMEIEVLGKCWPALDWTPQLHPLSPKGAAHVINLPETENSLVVRTDFSDQEAWEACRSAIEASGQAEAFVEILDDPAYRDSTVRQLLEKLPHGEDTDTYLMLADRQTMATDGHPILVLDLFDQGRGRTARVASSQLWEVVGNLDNGNMDVQDYANAAAEDGVFRGFR